MNGINWLWPSLLFTFNKEQEIHIMQQKLKRLSNKVTEEAVCSSGTLKRDVSIVSDRF